MVGGIGMNDMEVEACTLLAVACVMAGLGFALLVLYGHC